MTVHQRLAAAVIVLGVVGALIGLVSAMRGGAGPTWRSYLVLTAALVGVQAVIGLVLVLSGHRPQGLHWVYGAATLLALPVAGLLSRGRTPRAEAWVLCGGCVALILLAARAYITGS